MKNKKKILLIIGMWLFTIIVLVLRFLDRRALITGAVEQICDVLMWICMMVVWILGALKGVYHLIRSIGRITK